MNPPICWTQCWASLCCEILSTNGFFRFSRNSWLCLTSASRNSGDPVSMNFWMRSLYEGCFCAAGAWAGSTLFAEDASMFVSVLTTVPGLVVSAVTTGIDARPRLERIELLPESKRNVLVIWYWEKVISSELPYCELYKHTVLSRSWTSSGTCQVWRHLEGFIPILMLYWYVPNMWSWEWSQHGV